MTDQSNPPKPLTTTRAIARQATSYMAFRGEALDPDDPLLGFRPVPSKHAPRRNAITPARQRAFISALAASGIVVEAARHIGVSTEALYRLRNKPGGEDFRAAWDLAVDRAMSRLEAGAFSRALHGEERLVVSGGQLMGTEVRHNDALVMFFLRNRRGERYAADWRQLKPGHPVYEKLRGEVLAEYHASLPSIEEVREEILRKVERIEAHRRRQAKAIVEEERDGEDGRAETEND
jgi:hypothetical protein